MKYFIGCLLLLSSVWIYGQGVKGTVVNEKQEPVAYAHIYIPELKTGTTSNINGEYQLKLPSGEYHILFQYLGYSTKEKTVRIENNFADLDVVLQSQDMRIKEIKVLASGEDPAYYVMRRAIAMAPYYRNQISQYDCQVYLKGSGVITKIPRIFKKKLKKQGVESNKQFVLETLSNVHFELPDKLEQKVVAMRSSGDDNQTSPMEMITNNLYQASEYGIVSPFDKTAFQAYTFKLEGVFEDQGRLINKIKVTPKRKGKDLFSGYLNIAEVFWNIHSADLQLEIPMAHVSMRQLYAPVNKNTWMPVSLDFDINFSGLGFALNYQYVASISKYNVTLNPNLDHAVIDQQKMEMAEEQIVVDQIEREGRELYASRQNSNPKRKKEIDKLIDKEELSNRDMKKLQRLMEKESQGNAPLQPLEIKDRIKVSKNATKNNSLFWADIRPIPLTSPEIVSFSKKDSIVEHINSPAYKDSVRNRIRRFKLTHLITGKTYTYKEDSANHTSRLKVPGVIDLVEYSFNTVDGFRLELPFIYTVKDTLGHHFSIAPRLAYAFSREHFDAILSAYWKYNGLKNAGVRISGGTHTVDYNETHGMNSMPNTIYSLFFEKNLKKFYKKDFIAIEHQMELFNGLDLSAKATFSNRMPLNNHSGFKIIDYDYRAYTPNIPQANVEEAQLLQSKAATIALGISYTPKRRYYIRNHTKYPAESKYPTFSVNYKKAINGLFNTDADYDFISAGIRHAFNTGFNDHLWYAVSAGKFLNTKNMHFADFKHFSANPRTVMLGNSNGTYRLLNYYEASTGEGYIEGHLNWESDRFLLKRLPILNNTIISEKLSLKFLSMPHLSNYMEAGYGLKNIFLLFDAELVNGFNNFSHTFTKIKFSITLN